MPGEKVRIASHPLDVGSTTFQDILTARFDELRDDLIAECERIAYTRELKLKSRLENAEEQVLVLRQEAELGLQLAGSLTTLGLEEQPKSRLSQLKQAYEERASALETTLETVVNATKQAGRESAVLMKSQWMHRAHSIGEEADFGTSSMSSLPGRGLSDKNHATYRSPSATAFADPKEAHEPANVKKERRVVCLDDLSGDGENPVSGAPAGDSDVVDSAEVDIRITQQFAVLVQDAEDAGNGASSALMSRGNPEHFRLWTEWSDASTSNSLKGMSGLELEDVKLDDVETHWIHSRDHKALSPRDEVHQQCCTISPNSTLGMYWDLLGVPMLIYDLVTIPLQVFYTAEGSTVKIITWVVILYWSLDMFFRMFVCGYVNKLGKIILNRGLIMRHYFRTNFGFDLIMVAPDYMSMILGAPRNVQLLRVARIMRMLRLLRLTKIQRATRKIYDLIDSEYLTILVHIFNNLVAILGCCHYVGCFWFWLGNQCEKPSKQCWVQAYEFEDLDWTHQYAFSLQWAVAQFTPGASKIHPVNESECYVAILVLIFGIVFFSLFVSSMTQQRMRLQALTSKLDRETWVLRRYLRQHGVSSDLALRTVKYVDVVVAPVISRVQRKDVGLLEYLSKPLQLEIQAEMFYGTLLVHPFLHSLKSHSTTLTAHLFANVVVEMMLGQTDLLFEVGQVSHEWYFVSKGVLAYLLSGTNQVEHVNRGHWICEPVIWVPWVHKGTTRAAEECGLISIDSAKMRTSVLEHKDRGFVRRCALGYINDLNRHVDNDDVLSDTIRVSDDPDSEYMAVVGEFVVGEVAGSKSSVLSARQV